jgi:hypothetical protein
MNYLLPRPWDAVAYALALLISLGMFAAVLLFISSHCERVLEQTGAPGACGLGVGWILICIAFLVIAGYSAYQLYVMQKKQKRG